MVVGRRKDLPDTDIACVDQVGVGQEVAGGDPQARSDARLGYIAEATANSDKPGGRGKRPTA